MVKFLSYWGMLALISSCSLINMGAVKTTVNVIHAGSDEILTEANWEMFRQGTPANLKMLEGLWFADRSNKKLMTLLAKGYSGYGFGVHETQALPSILLEEDSDAKEQAILSYEKAIFYGLKLLEHAGIDQEKFFRKEFSTNLAKEFDQKFETEDLVGIFYFAQSLGSSINLQRDNIAKMAYLNHVREMLNWVCGKAPDLEQGSCSLAQAVIEASTPSILGGSQQRAAEMFKNLISMQPYNHMVRLSFIQYHVIPMLDEDLYREQVKLLANEIAIWQRGIKDPLKKAKKYHGKQKFNLHNSIAKKRYEKLISIEKKLF